MRQQRRNRILHIRTQRGACRRPMRERLFEIFQQQLVEIRIGADDRHEFDGRRKHHLVHARAEFDLASQERSELGGRLFPVVHDPDPARHHTAIGKLPAQADQRHQPEFHVMPVRPPVDADVVERNRGLLAGAGLQRNSFIRDAAIAFRAVQSIGQYLRRRQNVIEQPDLAKIVVLRQMKSEKIILQRIGGELQKLDLALRAEAGSAIVDLLDRQPGARQQRSRINAGLDQARRDQAGDTAGSARHRVKSHQSGSAHGV